MSSRQADFNSVYSDKDKAAMLLMSLGIEDSDLDLLEYADNRAIRDFFVNLILSKEVKDFLTYLRK